MPHVIELTLREIPRLPAALELCLRQPARRAARPHGCPSGLLRAQALLQPRRRRTARGSLADELRRRVRQANEPIDLWLLRTALLTALPDDQPERAEEHRLAMQQALSRVMPRLAMAA